MTDREVGKLGRLKAERPDGLHSLAYYQSNPLPKAPIKVNVPNVRNWGMLGNDKYGNCTFAGIVHARMAHATSLKLTEKFPSSDEVVKAYLKFTNNKDTGVIVSKLLNHWQKNDLFGSKLEAFAPTDRFDLDELKSVIAQYGLAYIGVDLPATYSDQFRKGEPWALTGTPMDNNSAGGHCIILVGYDEKYIYSITWGKVQPITWEWLKSYIKESWALITPEIVTKGQFGQVRLGELLSDLEQLKDS